MKEIVDFENFIKNKGLDFFKDRDLFFKAKQIGFSDKELTIMFSILEKEV